MMSATVCGLLAVLLSALAAAADSPVFPQPRQLDLHNDCFPLDRSAAILVPPESSPEDWRLARLLAAELADRYGYAIPTRTASSLPAEGRFIIMGSPRNPLVRRLSAAKGLESMAAEGYVLEVEPRLVLVAGAGDAGAFYGLQSLRQLIERDPLRMRGVRIRDWPHKPFRGLKMYLPGRENVPFFKRFVRDAMALYKFNKLILELNAAMRLDRHPELNAGWLDFGRSMLLARRDRSWGPGRQFQDSSNADTADYDVLEKDEVAELVRYARQFFIEVIPEIPTLTHSYYLLTRHRELAEIPDAEWPDTYCPSEPRTYDLVLDVLDEYIEVMKPGMVHLGHDEWRMPLGVCPRCRGKDPGELFAADLNRLHAHLRRKNVEVAIWGDHLIEALRGKRSKHVPNPGGTPYDMPGALSPEQVRRLIPKDILIFNWFWDDTVEGCGEANDVTLEQFGFRQVYGNFRPAIRGWERRSRRSGVLGGAPSSWAATNELNFGKDQMYDLLGSAALLWSVDWPAAPQLSETVQRLLPGIRSRLGATPLPSQHDPAVPVRIEARRNAPALAGLKSGALMTGKRRFELTGAIAAGTGPAPDFPRESPPIRIGEDVSSLVFLHAAARPAGNRPAYEAIWNYADTADLLGWYEVRYEDGLVETVPVRYGVNILEAGWGNGHDPRHVAYEAELVECGATPGSRVTFFAYEWINPRLGKAVAEVRLRGISRFEDAKGRPSQENAILLGALSMVKKRVAPEEKPKQEATWRKRK